MPENPFIPSDIPKYTGEEIKPLATYHKQLEKPVEQILGSLEKIESYLSLKQSFLAQNIFATDFSGDNIASIKTIDGQKYFLAHNSGSQYLALYSPENNYEQPLQIENYNTPGLPVAAVGAELILQSTNNQFTKTATIAEIKVYHD